MCTILVVDDMPAFREPIAACLQSKGYDVRCATNGSEALAIVRKELPSLVLLDVGMPVMDGLTFLEKVSADPTIRNLPVILLTAVAERDSVIRAAKLGVRDYLLKSRFSLKELLTRVASRLDAKTLRSDTEAQHNDPACELKSVSASVPVAGNRATPTPALPKSSSGAASVASLKRIISDAELKQKLGNCDEIGSLPPAVDNALNLTSHAGCSIHELAKAIKQDQGLSLRVLRLANSVTYSRGTSVASIDLAIQRIGIAQIRQMIMAIGVVDRFSDGMRAAGLNPPKFWEHSIACSLIAAELTRCRNGPEDQVDSAFTMSLLHDIGRALLAEKLGDTYGHVLRTAEQLAVPLELIESRMLGVNHAELMQDLLRRWKFGQHLAAPIAKHHLSIHRMRDTSDPMAPIYGVLSLADRLAHALLVGSSGNDTIYPIHELAEWLKIDAAVIEKIAQTIHDQTNELKFILLSRAQGADWPDHRRELAAKLRERVRPIFIGDDLQHDSFQVFFRALVGEACAESPNLMVVHLARPKNRAVVETKVSAADNANRDKLLPTLIISPDGESQLSEQLMSGRPCGRIQSPASIGRLIDVTNSLLGQAA